MITRRALFPFAGLCALAPLVGCKTGQPVTPASVATDVGLIAKSFAAALPSLALPSGVAALVNSALADLQAVAAAIVSADTVAAAQPLVARVEADVNGVVAALAGITLPANAANVLQAAQVLLPVLEMAVGMVVPVGAQLGAMSPDAARAVLAASAAPVERFH